MMFAGTSSGAVRAIKFPLGETGEWQEYQAHCGTVNRVRATFKCATSPVSHCTVQQSHSFRGVLLEVIPSSNFALSADFDNDCLDLERGALYPKHLVNSRLTDVSLYIHMYIRTYLPVMFAFLTLLYVVGFVIR